MKVSPDILSKKTVDQYLSVLEVEPRQLDLSLLRSLIRAHLHTIPYENFSKFHYVQTFHERGSYLPNTEEFLRQFIAAGWGGTCYPLNMHFSKLLGALGFSCNLVRVNAGHVAIRVTFHHEHYYVDVGYGCPLFKPIPLAEENSIKIKKMGEEVFLRSLERNYYEIERYAAGKSFVKKIIDWTPRSEEEFLPDIQKSVQNDNDNIVMRRLNATIFRPRYCYYLSNNTITRKNEYTKEEAQFNDLYKWAEKVYEVFGIDQSVALKAASFLKNQGISLFSTK